MIRMSPVSWQGCSQHINIHHNCFVYAVQTTVRPSQPAQLLLLQHLESPTIQHSIYSCNCFNKMSLGKLTAAVCVCVCSAGDSVFFTGCAGTGKSLLLKHILRALPCDTAFVTASTGMAASALGGTTINAFAGQSCFASLCLAML